MQVTRFEGLSSTLKEPHRSPSAPLESPLPTSARTTKSTASGIPSGWARTNRTPRLSHPRARKMERIERSRIHGGQIHGRAVVIRSRSRVLSDWNSRVEPPVCEPRPASGMLSVLLSSARRRFYLSHATVEFCTGQSVGPWWSGIQDSDCSG